MAVNSKMKKVHQTNNFKQQQSEATAPFPTPEEMSSSPRREASPISEPSDFSDHTSKTKNAEDDSVDMTEYRSRGRLQSYLTLTPLQRNILKNSLTYFLASLFTFSPLANLLPGTVDERHSGGISKPSPMGHIGEAV